MARKRHPGKFEANVHEAVAEKLHQMLGEGMADEEVGDVQTFGFAALFDRGKKKSYVVYEDNQGFFEYEEFSTGAAAKKHFSKIERKYDKFMEEAGEGD